jgi:DNA repair photolyase
MKPISLSQLWKKRLGDWVINPYVGCEHGCSHCYCPAMPGVKFFNHGHTQRQWGTYLYPKIGIAAALRDQLRNFSPDKAKRTDWGDGWVLMSILTDCYPPAEAKHRITRQCLQLLLEAGHKVRVQTRSVLVERDFDLLVAHKPQVLLGTSLPHLDDRLARWLEPRAASPTRRLQMLEKAAALDIPVYAAVAPFLPFHDLTTLEHVINAVQPLGPSEIFCEVLNPKGDNIAMMTDALKGEFPDFAARLAMYSNAQWAKFTLTVLAHGIGRSTRFIPWPDTRRFWRKYLTQEHADFLETFLPPRETEAVPALVDDGIDNTKI